MRIDAIYQDGVIKPLKPLRLKSDNLRVQVIIPDEDIAPEPISEEGSMRNKINAILGPYAHPRPAATPAEDKTAWNEHLTKKYGS